jgi:hypothetical protein
MKSTCHPPIAFCLPPIADCLLPTAYCLLAPFRSLRHDVAADGEGKKQ